LLILNEITHIYAFACDRKVVFPLGNVVYRDLHCRMIEVMKGLICKKSKSSLKLLKTFVLDGFIDTHSPIAFLIGLLYISLREMTKSAIAKRKVNISEEDFKRD